MSEYSELRIGNLELAYRNCVPDFVSLLFRTQDYISSIAEWSTGAEDEEDLCYEHQFKTTSRRAAEALRKARISPSLLRDLHFAYFAFNYEEYVEELRYRCLQYVARRYPTDEATHREERLRHRLLRRFRHFSPDEEFEHILRMTVLMVHGETEDLDSTVEDLPVLGRPSGANQFDELEFHREQLSSLLTKDPYVELISDYTGYYDQVPFDVHMLYHVGLGVFASAEEDIPIVFDFGRIVESSPPMETPAVEAMLDGMRSRVRQRADFMGAFAAVNPSGGSVGEIRHPSFKTPKQKGDFLQQMVAQIFSEEGFTVREKHTRGDQEIDLVIVNRQTDPFWLALQSPIIIVECKHTRRKVQAKDFRDFEGKVVSSGPLCKVGIIISMGGFTKQCNTALRRSSYRSHRIVLVDKSALDRKLKGNTSTKKWLEEIILDQF